jgi:hypothetical protein
VHTELRVPYRDTTADDLMWRLGEPPCPALATLELAVPGGHLELRLLGNSHQVIFAAGGTVISEVVACAHKTRPVALPATVGRALSGWDYRFRSATHRLAPDRFGYWVDRLVNRLSEHPAAIVGHFPGSPHAVTALLAGGAGTRAGLRWRTWHAYPGEARLVATGTVVQPQGKLAR